MSTAALDDMRRIAPRYTVAQMFSALRAFADGASSREAANLIGCTPRQVLVWAKANGVARGSRRPCPRATESARLIRGGLSVSAAARAMKIDRRTATKAKDGRIACHR